ncbi:glycerophosphodiester phosphodiesterase [Leucobacter weissii]|uniref:Glycerophosphodiester phosphodiesterase n=1 Tax=Leucobacter weissii TaxID=1983706 RepID=A0A939MQ38_9MICO|nr:glycerophosphodiester phosphodiesterase family protein [Leucobacter weissii]MBO1900979.1 glycerophosphodiester phosphodiesterase [Leucobacter weissii]
MPHPYLSAAPRPRVLAHRGLVTEDAAARGITENTRASFAAARNAGAVYLESDCRLTRDGVVVLFHDADLRRVVGDPRPVSAVEHRELVSLMSGRGGLLTLQDALEAFPGSRFNIDVKSLAAADPGGRIIAPHADRVLVAGFSDRVRRRALRAAAAVPGASRPATSPGRGALVRILLAVASRSRILQANAFAGVDALQIPERQGRIRVLAPRLVDAAHRAGVEVHVWTVNDPERMAELVGMGVDGIVTDRADAALATLQEAEKG